MKQYTTFTFFVHKLDIEQSLAAHERLGHWVVRRQWLGALSYAEALQVGRIALWRAVQHYDVRRGTAFSTYAVPAIARAVWRALAQAQSREILTPHPPQEAPDLDEAVQRSLVHDALYHMVESLPHPLGYVILAHYGLDGRPAQTFAAIAQSLGVTRQRVQQLEACALLWLAHPAHSLPLRQLLDCNALADYRTYPGPPAHLAARKEGHAMKHNHTELTASQKRAAHPDFVKTFSLQALRRCLPLLFPVPAGLPPSPKRKYRSYYRYLGQDDLADPAVLATLSLFEIALR